MKRICFFLGIIMTLGSCEKVIDINLKNNEPLLVAEGEIKEGVHDVNVYLTYTSDYFAPGSPSPVGGAVVKLTDSIGTYTFPEVSPGRYVLPGYNARARQTYSLAIQQAGKTYAASAYLPPVVVLDSISYKYETASAFTDAGYLIYAEFNDPPATDNYYRIKLTVNDTLRNKPEDLFVFDDQLTNGRHIKIPIFIKRFKKGDRIHMELIGMDEKVYKYFLTLTTIISTSGQPSAAPANPISNFSGNILGVFGAYSSSTQSVSLPL
ncbi:MAG: DUF4249 domain-containing protein [Ferruginibacter sp.]